MCCLLYFYKMKKKTTPPIRVESIARVHQYLGLQSPEQPLVSVIDLQEVNLDLEFLKNPITNNFYSISLKKNAKGKMKYGQQNYDFDEGVMSFMAPLQVSRMEVEDVSKMEGSLLIVHPDFFQSYPLATKIKSYGFFEYAVHEALHLSEDEEQIILQVLKNIKHEIKARIDLFTQDLIVSYIDLLLNYSNRFYHRQFVTRKTANSTLLSQVEEQLNIWFNSTEATKKPVPTVQDISKALHVSSNYLSDVLRHNTGMSTQQHIQNRVLIKAKEYLTTTHWTVGEIAFALGFEYPQSFSKFFKSKTQQTPMQFKKSFG